MPRILTLRLAALVAALALVAAVAHGSDLEARKLPPRTTGADLAPAATTYPTNAAKIFRWGNAQWYDDFISPVKRMWSLNRPSLVRDQHGMLTINATATSGTVSATLTGHGRRYGRWETRVRAEQYSSGATPYHVVAELVPASDYRCGARSIVLSDYALGTSRARMYLRNAPNLQYDAGKTLDLRPGPFHTYAVEVTPDHISWFVDTHVLMTERRASARTGATYALRLRLVGVAGARMNPGRMQMDWVRYYTLERKNARSIEAPQARLGTFADAC